MVSDVRQIKLYNFVAALQHNILVIYIKQQNLASCAWLQW